MSAKKTGTVKDTASPSELETVDAQDFLKLSTCLCQLRGASSLPPGSRRGRKAASRGSTAPILPPLTGSGLRQAPGRVLVSAPAPPLQPSPKVLPG